LLSLRHIGKSFGQTRVLDDISFEIGEREFLTILGESGSGKTTLLRILAGFEKPDTGEVWMDGVRLDTVPPNRRNVNTVFQHYALFPHLSVFENVAYGLRSKKLPGSEITARVTGALKQMKMCDLSRRRPAQLSGGQQQRVALARALVNRPRVLLLDEPLSALDANLRRHMQLELKSLQREVGISFVFVTHDQEEAMALSDRIALLRRSRIEQLATPEELYHCPRTEYVATFVGQTNLLRASVESGRASIGPLEWATDSQNGEALFSLRPENVAIAHNVDQSPGKLTCRATIVRRVFTGFSELLEANCDGGLSLLVRVRSGAKTSGDVTLEIDTQHLVPLSKEA
jgi:ABC-type Fe3+/spermidine/putrescine transport system ATPase subunit